MYDTSENKEFICSADGLKTLRVVSKNYKVRLQSTFGTELRIRYCENRFRKLEIQQRDGVLWLEEKMAVTFYELFHVMELLEDNELVIEIPDTCKNLNISVETGVAEIVVSDICADNLRLASNSGKIRISDVSISKNLSAHSVTNKIVCLLPGTESAYKIDCHADRMDVQQPYYPMNADAKRSILLHSGMFIPELMFTGGSL